MKFPRHRLRRFVFRTAVAACFFTLHEVPPAFAQHSATLSAEPAVALAETLTAACRQDQAVFATHLTAENAKAFGELPASQRAAVLKRFVLLEDSGKPLLSSGPEGNTVLRCEAGGVISEIRFGASQVRENLAFIPVEVPQSGRTQRVRFGLVREGGEWKLLSVGLLLVDIPAMAEQWKESDLEERETAITALLGKIAAALKSYQRAYGKLPESLEQLGPPPEGGVSPDQAGLLDAASASGESRGYRFRYTIVPATVEGDEAERNKAAGFTLAATPLQYEKEGRKSFYLDSSGTLRGADKHGAVATVNDPPLGSQAQP